MALVLNPALEEAMDSLSHHPIVEIVSSQNTSEIPFDGQFLTEETTNESKPNVITHSTGRLCKIYTFGTVFKYVYTDVDRQEFNFVTITPPTSHVPIEATLCELANGNIGIIYICTYSTNRQLRYLVISPTGTVITVDTQIDTDYVTATYVIDMPFVLRLINGTFLLVYQHKTVSGTTYQIKKRTCPADFTTWSAESECSVSISGGAATKPRYNPSLMQLTVGTTIGNVFLWFDYMDTLTGGVEITNVYYSISTDNGATWGTGVKLTAYTTTAAAGKHPVSVQKVANEMMMAFTEVRNALFKASHYAQVPASDMTFDQVGRKLYIVLGNHPTWWSLHGVMEIDVDSWTAERWWDEATDPAFDPIFFQNVNCPYNSRNHGEYPYIPVMVNNSGELQAAAVLNVSTNTIITYYFRNATIGGITVVQNITGFTPAPGEQVALTWVDAPSNRLYVLLSQQGPLIRVGYIEIGSYGWHEVVPPSAFPYFYGYYDQQSWIVDVANDRIIISHAWAYAGFAPGCVKVYSLSTGGEIHSYRQSTHPAFPYYGLKYIARIGEKIFGAGRDVYQGAGFRGLTEIDMTSGVVIVREPDWIPNYPDDWELGPIIPISSTELAMSTMRDGLTIFNIIDHSWIHINNESVPGLTPDASDYMSNTAISWDAQQQTIFAGTQPGYTYTGVIAVSRYGAFKTVYYEDGIYSGATWTFGILGVPGAKVQLTEEWVDYDLVMAVNPSLDDLSIYAFWTKMFIGEFSIKWDLDASSFEVSKYIENGTEVAMHRSIDGNPTSLSFVCSHGYLFDPQNITSLYSIYLKKGRKLNLRFGEKVGDMEYWQQQGIFFIISNSLSYERGQYPVINIAAEDERVFWEQGNIVATSHYETDPLTILKSVLVNLAGFTLGEIDMPIFDDACTLWYQWLDTSLQDIINQICERFGYFPRITVDGFASARKISGDNAIDHAYSNLTKIMNFTPDDDFSNFINQVIVTGQSHTFIEVLFAEEPVAEPVRGATGWWQGSNNYDIWYSPDHQRTCRYPRMEIIKSVKDGPYFMKDGKEYINSVPSDYRFVLTIEGPDLSRVFYQALTIYIVFKIVCYILNAIWAIGGMVALGCFLGSVYAMYNLMAIMGTQGNYNYNFYACPLGNVRQSFQAVADDEELQSLIGKVIPVVINDPFCYTQAQCQLVADFNRDILKFQRNRVKFTKIADLRDEEGDMISVPHPYTNQLMKIFVTELTRRHQKPSSPGSNDGRFSDNIEGWRIL